MSSENRLRTTHSKWFHGGTLYRFFPFAILTVIVAFHLISSLHAQVPYGIYTPPPKMKAVLPPPPMIARSEIFPVCRDSPLYDLDWIRKNNWNSALWNVEQNRRCIHSVVDNLAYYKPKYGRITLKQFSDLYDVIERTIKSREGKPALNRTTRINYRNYLAFERRVIQLTQHHAHCSIELQRHPEYSPDCKKRIREWISETNRIGKQKFEKFKAQNKDLKLQEIRNVPENITLRELMAFIDGRKYKTIEPGYLIGKVTIKDDQPKRELKLSSKRQELEAEVAAIERRLVEIDEKFEQFRARAQIQIAKQITHLKPFKDALEKAQKQKPPKRNSTVSASNRAFRIRIAKKRISQLGAAVANLEDQYTRIPFAADQRRREAQAHLRRLRLDIRNKQTLLNEELAAQSAGGVTPDVPIDRAAYIKAKDAYNTEQNEVNFRNKKLDDQWVDLEKRQQGHLSKLLKLNNQIADASEKLMKQEARKRAILEQISTDDAGIYFNFDFNQLNELNKSMAAITRALKEATDQREIARVNMIDAIDTADYQADKKIFAHYLSATGQAGLEAVFQIKDVAEAGAKGGPFAALAEAVHKIAFNSFDWAISGGPKIYEGDPKHAWYDVSGTETAQEIAAKQAKQSKNRIARKKKGQRNEKRTVFVADVISGYIKDGLHLNLQEAKLAELAQNVPQIDGGSRSMATYLQKQLAAQMKTVGDSREAWNDKTLKTNIGGFATRKLVDHVKGKIKSAVIDNAKKQLAQMLESGPIRNYLNAQVAVARSVDRFRKLGDIYWDRKAAYKALKKHRQKVLKGLELRKDRKIVLRKNNDFEPVIGYKFSLFYAKHDFKKQVKAKVFVAGYRLKKSRIINNYEMTKELVSYLNDNDLPSELPIKIILE